MVLNVSQIRQIVPPVPDVDRAEAFYEQVLCSRKFYRLGNLTCAGVGLPLENTGDLEGIKYRGCIDFRCADIAPAVPELGKRGLTLDGDSDGQILALMREMPKGHSPQAATH